MSSENNQDGWTNKDNADFYEKITASELKEIAELGGLADHSDLKNITDYISNAKCILEIGAGYGRVLDYLLKHSDAKLIGVERSQTFFNILQEKYRDQDRVKLIHADLFDFVLDERPDLVLWMWSGLAEFSCKEQQIIFEKMTGLLGNGSILIVDTILYTVSPINATILIKNNATSQGIIKIKDAVINVFHPSQETLDDYTRKIDIYIRAKKKYYTSTERERIVCIWGKQRIHDS